MKQQRQLWNRAIDDFLPKDRQKWSVIELYRGRALVRTALLGAVVHPFLYLFQNIAWQPRLQTLIGLALFLAPLAIVWVYYHTARLRICAAAYLAFSTAIVAWAQYAAATIYAQYWIWYCFLIVFCVLVLGVKEGALYFAFLVGLCFFIFRDNQTYGHSVGHFADSDALFGNMSAQVVMIQIAFLLLMTAYDSIRNRAETRAVMLRFSDAETDRLAAVGERIGGMALELNEQLNQFQSQILRLDGLAKRSDTKVEDLQTMIRELQDRSQRLAEISQISQLSGDAGDRVG